MQFVLFHGSFVGPEDSWLPAVKHDLESLSQTVITPQYPIDRWETVIAANNKANITKQNLQAWLSMFKTQVKPLLKSEPLCFIGHSLGPLFILHVVEKFKLKLDCAIFVAPFLRSPLSLSNFHGDENSQFIDRANHSFYRTDFNFTQLKRQIPTSYTLYSDNDPYIPTELSLEFASKLNSHHILIKGGQHLSMESGWLEFPLVTELCKTCVSANKYLNIKTT